MHKCRRKTTTIKRQKSGKTVIIEEQAPLISQTVHDVAVIGGIGIIALAAGTVASSSYYFWNGEWPWDAVKRKLTNSGTAPKYVGVKGIFEMIGDALSKLNPF